MRAVVHSAFGPASRVLAVRDVPPPSPAAGEALVRVRAAGVAKGNWLVTQGLPLIARPSYGIRRPTAPIAGLQFAGVVESVPDGETTLRVGDAVFGQHTGSFAELVAAPVALLARKPDAVSFEQAAAAPIPGIAALQALRAGAVASGQRVLVVGASGGVGSFVVQMAAGLGAHVTGVASTKNLPRLHALGAADTIDYTREDIDARGESFDVVIDIAGNRRISALRRVLTPTGTLVVVGGSGGRVTMGFERTVGAMLLDRFVTHRIVGLLSQPNREDLAALAELMARGIVRPEVHPALPLESASEAVERAGRGDGAGGLVLIP
jgi:NADPH:quinone reductase-like Zn-dependent oxidoreductase